MSVVLEVLGLLVMLLGLVLMAIGIFGIFRFKTFYARMLVVSKVDTVGVIVFLLGLAIRSGISFFSGKLFLIIVCILILSPLVSHMVARSAYISGVELYDHHTADEHAGDDRLAEFVEHIHVSNPHKADEHAGDEL